MRRLLLPLLLMTSCTTEPVYHPVAVDIPIAAPCPTPSVTHPAWPLQSIPPQAPLFDKVQAALIELNLRKAYETQIEAGLNACR